MFKIEINRNECEGKATCIEVCPENVLALTRPTEKLSFHAKLRLKFHGGKQATVINQDACKGCLACVRACPEGAIQVISYGEDTTKELPKSPFPEWHSFFLLLPGRGLFDNREKAVKEAGIKAGLTVLEVGCGPGFYTEVISDVVGEKGRVIAQDIEPKMLEKLKQRIVRFKNSSSIKPLLSSSSKINLPSDTVDVVFAVNVFEEIEAEGETEATARELYRLCKPGGTLFFKEHSHGVSKSEIAKIWGELKAVGFVVLREKRTFLSTVAKFEKPAGL